MLRRVALGGLFAALALVSGGATSALAGQVVYQHGGEVWAMNDDGSNQHQLLTAAEVPGMTAIHEPRVNANGGTTVAFVGETTADIAFTGSIGLYGQGLYVFPAGGSPERVSNPTEPSPYSEIFQLSPRWTADGKLLYRQDYEAPFVYYCVGVICSWVPAHDESKLFETEPLPGAGTGSEWALQHELNPNAYVFVPNPAAAGTVAYIGPQECKTNSCMLETRFYLSNGHGSDEEVAYGEEILGIDWSPDGSEFATTQGGKGRGIVIFSSPGAGNVLDYALEDPIQNTPQPGEVTFHDVVWAGSSALVFEAQDNLWSIPASCGGGTTTAPCQFPAQAKQLTFDGTASAPDTKPSWTSATQTLEPPAAPATTTSGSTSHTSGTTTQTVTGQGGNQTTTGTTSLGAIRTGRDAVTVTLRCGGPATSRCVDVAAVGAREKLRGSTVVAIQSRQRTTKRTALFVKQPVTLHGGATATVKLRLSASTIALLRRLGASGVDLLVYQQLGSSKYQGIDTRRLSVRAITHR